MAATNPQIDLTDDSIVVRVDDQTPDADIYVVETFVDEWDTERAVLDGETYPAKETIKFDWNQTHHKFDGDRKAWIVDADSLEALERELESDGYTVDFSTGGAPDAVLSNVCGSLEPRQDVTVHYEKKTGEGDNAYSGYVLEADPSADGFLLSFRRHKDDHFMYVQTDRSGKVALFTGGSHAPFVGAVEAIEVHDHPVDSHSSDDEEGSR